MVYPVDYLKLLEGGNFIHLVAMVVSDDKTSAVDTHNLRLKVCILTSLTTAITLTHWDHHTHWDHLTHHTHSLTDCYIYTVSQTPDITISLPSQGLKLYHPAALQVSFRNPLDKVLRNGVFKLLGESHVQSASAVVS